MKKISAHGLPGFTKPMLKFFIAELDMRAEFKAHSKKERSNSNA
jgi:hypothetical protein